MSVIVLSLPLAAKEPLAFVEACVGGLPRERGGGRMGSGPPDANGSAACMEALAVSVCDAGAIWGGVARQGSLS